MRIIGLVLLLVVVGANVVAVVALLVALRRPGHLPLLPRLIPYGGYAFFVVVLGGMAGYLLGMRDYWQPRGGAVPEPLYLLQMGRLLAGGRDFLLLLLGGAILPGCITIYLLWCQRKMVLAGKLAAKEKGDLGKEEGESGEENGD